MSHPDEGSPPQPIPAWALQRANDELYDTTDAEVITRRAQDIAEESRQLDDERHDEFDDPDQGGEA
jgi:hypothetical protein